MLDEKELLSSQFKELALKFQALLEKLENQLNDFLNGKNADKNNINSGFLTFKEELIKRTDKLITDIRADQKNEIEILRTDWENKKQLTNNLKIRKEGIKHTRFFEKEIDEAKSLISELQKTSIKLTSESENNKREIETFDKQWGLDGKDLQKSYEREIEKFDEQKIYINNRVIEIDSYIENSKDSFYGWLNEKYPDWESTIGKVIDEKNVLFNTSLSPKLSIKSNNFYGVELDLNELNKSVRTVTDYQSEKDQLKEKIIAINKDINDLMEKSEKEKDNLKRKFQPKIREKKERIKENEYLWEQNQIKLGEATIKLNGLVSNAEIEKKKTLENIENLIEKSIELELATKRAVDAVEEELNKLVKAKEREREKKSETEAEKVRQLLITVEAEIKIEKEVIQKRKVEINSQKESELSKKGVDTIRIAAIDERLTFLQVELNFIDENRDKVADYKKDKREILDRVEEFKKNKLTLEKQLEQEEKKHMQIKETINKDLEIVMIEISSLTQKLNHIKEDNEAYQNFKGIECYNSIQEYFLHPEGEIKTEKRVKILIDEIKEIHYDKLNSRIDELRKTTIDFLGKFSDDNIFKFKKQLTDNKSFLEFAMMLSDFVEENKIERIEKEVNERFALIITTIGTQTNSLVSESGKIQAVIKKINDDFVERNFVGVIKKIELKVEESKNEIVQLLIMIKKYNDENSLELGTTNLFSSESQEKKNKEAIDILKQFVKKINELKRDHISLSDSFELKFRIEENQNDTGWVEKLSNVGSDGTDVLVKAMVNIMLLNVFKEGASKRFKDFQLHCMMDEIGKLHPNNVRGILKFANDRNILLINSSPIENDALAFKHIYKLKKDLNSNNTKVNRILTQYS